MFDPDAQRKKDFLEMVEKLGKQIRDPETYGFFVDLKNEFVNCGRPELFELLTIGKWNINCSDKLFRAQMAAKCTELIIALFDTTEKLLGTAQAMKAVSEASFTFD